MVWQSSSSHQCCCQCEALQLQVFFYKGDDDDVDNIDESPGTLWMTYSTTTHVESWELQSIRTALSAVSRSSKSELPDILVSLLCCPI